MITWMPRIPAKLVAIGNSRGVRLPKALIHHNVEGQPIHTFLQAFDRAWAIAAPQGTFGPRQRWLAAVEQLQQSGMPILDGRTRWKLGEVTVPWSIVAPRAS